MRDIESFSISRVQDKEIFKRFDKIRGVMGLKRSEAILTSLKEFNTNHPLEKAIMQITDYITDEKPEYVIPPISIYTDIKEMKSICNKADKKKLLLLKDKLKRLLNTVDLELEDRIDR